MLMKPYNYKNKGNIPWYMRDYFILRPGLIVCYVNVSVGMNVQVMKKLTYSLDEINLQNETFLI